MSPTRVMNVRGLFPARALAQVPRLSYVGRACDGWSRSTWANPFPADMNPGWCLAECHRLGVDASGLLTNRNPKAIGADNAVELYRRWMVVSGLDRHVDLIRGRTLGCWCVDDWSTTEPVPDRSCHAVLISLVADGKVDPRSPYCWMAHGRLF